MSHRFHWCDNIHTTVFTPRDFQVELLATAFERNTMICLGHKSSKEFIALKLLQELAGKPRNVSKIGLYLTCPGAPSMNTMVQHLTDLKVYTQEQPNDVLEKLPEGYQVYIVHPRSCLAAFRSGALQMSAIHLLVLEDCHEMEVHREIMAIFKEFFDPCDQKMELPKVLGLAGPLHSAECSLQELGAMLNILEKTVYCETETASDIVTVLRYCAKPFEYIVQCAPYQQNELTIVVEDMIRTRIAFLNDHRYDPFEIYNTDEFIEELKGIPDPKQEPLEFLHIMLTVLYEMGPWCADRVALNMFHRIEKQKIKTPHERHYILLCLVNTALLEIHSMCELTFRKLKNHKQQVERYSSPKVLRLLDVLRMFKPEDIISENETMQRLSSDLELMNFKKLSVELENKCQNVENIAIKQQLASRSIVENLDPIIKSTETGNELALHQQRNQQTKKQQAIKTENTASTSTGGDSTTTRSKNNKKHGPYKRSSHYCRKTRENSDGLDSLCCIIYCNSNHTARVLFDLLAEMSRHDPDLKFLKSQFTTDRVADPTKEPKEAEAEHRRQEDVLKRFRTHECNVLIGTSVLEEGIDVPKCNLVVRWDAPTTYRSYVQCKGRARAAPAYHIILVAAPQSDTNASNANCTVEQLSEYSHRRICKLDASVDDTIESDSSDDEQKSKKDYATKHTIIGTVKILNPEVITNKPPTASEIVLKEIQDEMPAIEGIKDLEDIKNLSLDEIKEDVAMAAADELNANITTSNPEPQTELSTTTMTSSDELNANITTSNPEPQTELSSTTMTSSDELNTNITTSNRETQTELSSTMMTSSDELNANITTSNPEPKTELSSTTMTSSDELNANIITSNRETQTELSSNTMTASDELNANITTSNPEPKTELSSTTMTASDELNANITTSNPEPKTELSSTTMTSADELNANITFSNTESKPQQSPSFISYSKNIAPTDCFEVTSLDNALSKVTTQLTDTTKKSVTSPPVEKKSPDRQKVKRRFQCCVNEEDAIKNENNSDSAYKDKLLQMESTTNGIVDQLAKYREIEKMLLKKCANIEPPEMEHRLAEEFSNCIQPYKPMPHLLTGATVDLSSSIALVNKYCMKLPSDSFTKLTPLWRCAQTKRNGVEMFQYTIRLPINSPLKYDIVGLPMATHILARRMAALQACIELHKCGELDDYLQPIGKEGFRAIESDWESFELEGEDEEIVRENLDPRPGTTKRRQYYYKRIASEFCDCRPTAGIACYLYLLDLKLQCPIPEEQNTRGRKIYPPEDAQQGFGILTLKKIPKVSSFPIFTRSGEVKVNIELYKNKVILTEQQICCINTFLNYTFTNVLRLQKFLMLFDPDSTENCVFIVPTLKSADGGYEIDWEFLALIEKNASVMPTAVLEDVRKSLDFDSNRFNDAVVMPWYRNQDQPQYFYVAEICPHLSPLSCFPGENYRTFKHYYLLKYKLTIQNAKQPLLDVDHTSARLNFLTPRYVNRKGVALPTSSEETKRAKRENLEQKQILVPELCTVHPFPASLWRTAVCLPCILYRVNGLLLADDIRKKVSADIGLGQQEIDKDFEWPMLDFGWSLSEVLKKSKDNQEEKSASEESKEKVDVETVGGSDAKSKLPKSANEIVIEGEKKLQDSGLIEIGTWSNEMANDIKDFTDDEEDEQFMKFLPPNVSFCDQEMRYGSPNYWGDAEPKPSSEPPTASFGLPKKGKRTPVPTYYDSVESLVSSYDDNYSYGEADYDDEETGIEFTSKNEAETIETEQEIEKRNKQLSIIQASNANERNYQETKNLQVGYNFVELKDDIEPQLNESITQCVESMEQLKEDINKSGMLVKHNCALKLPRKEPPLYTAMDSRLNANLETLTRMFPYASLQKLEALLAHKSTVALTVEDVTQLNLEYVQNYNGKERFTILGCGDIFDNFNDNCNLDVTAIGYANSKCIKINFESKTTKHKSRQHPHDDSTAAKQYQNHFKTSKFSFDYQPALTGHPGPSPSIILQALTMSNANDGINLERLETIGDSFLKYAITTYLYITYENVHEGKLSHLRSKQVANLNLYRLGRRKMLGEYMIATKFEPHDNWLPPCYYVPKKLEKELIEAKIPLQHWRLVDLPHIKKLTNPEICDFVRAKAFELGLVEKDAKAATDVDTKTVPDSKDDTKDDAKDKKRKDSFIPYNLVTQHSIPDKSVADCVEALIGAYLIECGSRGALIFMAWLGIRVLPYTRTPYSALTKRIPGSTNPDAGNITTVYGEWTPPISPLLHYSPNAEQQLEIMLEGYDKFETILGYKFHDRAYLLQAMTHASYSPNRLTDCYQRLEFLGDAVLDYLITRHLYEDPRQHSPGALTDLRSALVNNTIFASLAVRHGFHKYFRHLSPGLNDVIDRFVRIQNENGHSISEEYYLLSEEECDDAEDVEVPKALGDVFESIAGAIFLDSNMSLDVVWEVYSNMMRPEIEQFSNSVPKSPIRELLELEPETAKFGKPEKLADGRRVRVTVEVFCKGTFRGIGRNYRIAKCTAAKCALRQLKKQGLITKKD